MGGHALSDLAARWQEDVLDLRPDVLSVFIGTNDVERHLRKLLRADDPQAVPDFRLRRLGEDLPQPGRQGPGGKSRR